MALCRLNLCYSEYGPPPACRCTQEMINVMPHSGHSETICILMRFLGQRKTNIGKLKLRVIEEEGVREERQFSIIYDFYNL